eukprot:3305793-Amphidinium_carterae.1
MMLKWGTHHLRHFICFLVSPKVSSHSGSLVELNCCSSVSTNSETQRLLQPVIHSRRHGFDRHAKALVNASSGIGASLSSLMDADEACSKRPQRIQDSRVSAEIGWQRSRHAVLARAFGCYIVMYIRGSPKVLFLS